MSVIRRIFAFTVLLFSLFSITAHAAEVDETHIFTRDKGKPVIQRVNFDASPGQDFLLTLFNGGEDKSMCRISSATVKLNGKIIFKESDFRSGKCGNGKCGGDGDDDGKCGGNRGKCGNHDDDDDHDKDHNHDEDHDKCGDKHHGKCGNGKKNGKCGSVKSGAKGEKYKKASNPFFFNKSRYSRNKGKYQSVYMLSKEVELLEHNELAVRLRSKPGCGIEINVQGRAEDLQIISTPQTSTVTGETWQYTVETTPQVDWAKTEVTFPDKPAGMTFENGVMSWSPELNDAGVHPVNFTLASDEYGQAQQNFTITVDHINQAPTAQNQNISVDEDSSTTFLLQASDIDTSELVYSIVTQPANGTLTLNGAEIVYTPVADYFGNDSFTFKANDGEY